MPRLSISIEYLARFRSIVNTKDASLLQAVSLLELAGAEGIVCRLLEERSYFKEGELQILRSAIQSHFNLALPYSENMVRLAAKTMPDMVTLVAPKIKSLDAPPTIDVTDNTGYISEITERLRSTSIIVNMFIEPTLQQVKAAARTGTDYITLSTARYSMAKNADEEAAALDELSQAALGAAKIGLGSCATYGLNYQNIRDVASINNIEELFVGGALFSRAILIGLDRAVRDLIAAMR